MTFNLDPGNGDSGSRDEISRRVREYWANLKRLNDIYGDLLALARQKEKVLLNRDYKALEALVCCEERLVYEAAVAEKVRSEAYARLCEAAGFTGKEAFPQTLKAQFGSEYDLDECLDELCTNVELLLDQNSLNSQLISSSLSYVDFMLRMISESRGGSKTPAPTYGVDGKAGAQKQGTQRFIDIKK